MSLSNALPAENVASGTLPFIVVENVTHSFPNGRAGDRHALRDVSLTIESGAFVTLVGASGVGKSTLLRLLGGLITPSRGRVLVDGHDPAAARTPVGIVFQSDNLMPWRTAAANVRLPLEIRGVPPAESQARVAEMLSLVGLSGFGDAYPAQLSGGMAQRVAIARALIHRPSLLLLDEPFGALDALTRERMAAELLRIWRAFPVTVFMVTHSIPEAVLLSDLALVMNSRPGTIAESIPVSLPRPRHQSLDATPDFQTCVRAIRAVIQP